MIALGVVLILAGGALMLRRFEAATNKVATAVGIKRSLKYMGFPRNLKAALLRFSQH